MPAPADWEAIPTNDGFHAKHNHSPHDAGAGVPLMNIADESAPSQAEQIADRLTKAQVAALLGMPFLSRGSGHSPSVLRTLRECEWSVFKAKMPMLADHEYFSKYEKRWYRTPFGEQVAAILRARAK